MRLTKQQQEMIETIEQWPEGDYTVYLNEGYEFLGQDGGAFSADTIKEIKETLKQVRKAA